MSIILLAIIFSSGFLSKITGGVITRQLSFCEETDGGDNSFLRGETVYVIRESPFYKKNYKRQFNDACSYGDTLIEYHCSEKFRRLASKLYHCKKGCEDGACISEDN
tara:strand:- start:1596 stop:1916 length:321 start_codon:yes stop_codon:yes gene_type:complete